MIGVNSLLIYSEQPELCRFVCNNSRCTPLATEKGGTTAAVFVAFCMPGRLLGFIIRAIINKAAGNY